VVLYLGLSVGLSIFVSLFWLVVVVGLHFILECVRQVHPWRDRTEVVLHALWEVKLDVGLVILAFTLVLYIDVVLGLLGVQAAARAAGTTVRIGVRAAAWERNLRTFLLTVDEMARIGHAAVLYGSRRRNGATTSADPRTAPPAAPGPEGVLQAATPAPGPEGVVQAATPAPGPEGVLQAATPAPGPERARPTTSEVQSAAPAAMEPEDPRPATPEIGPATPEIGPATPEIGPATPEIGPATPEIGPATPARPAWREPWGWGDRIGLTLVTVGMLLIMLAPLITSHDVGSALVLLLEQLRPFPES